MHSRAFSPPDSPSKDVCCTEGGIPSCFITRNMRSSSAALTPPPFPVVRTYFLIQLHCKHRGQDWGQGKARPFPVFHPRREPPRHQQGRSVPTRIALLAQGPFQSGEACKKTGRCPAPLQPLNHPIRSSKALGEGG